MKEKLNLLSRVSTPAASVLAREFLEKRESIFVPTAKRLDDEWLEMYALGATIVEMGAVFGRFAGVDGCSWVVGRLNDDGFLRGGGDADVEGNLPPIHPVFDVDVGWPRESPWDEAWHLLPWIERAMLSHSEDFIAYAIVTATFHAAVVTAVQGVIAKAVLGLKAGRRATVAGRKKGETETVSHRRSEGPRVHVQRKRRRWERIEPVAGVRKSERVEAGFVTGGGRGEEERSLVDVNLGGERVLRGGRREERERGVSGVA